MTVLDNVSKGNDANANYETDLATRSSNEQNILKDSLQYFPGNIAFKIGRLEDDAESGFEVMSSEHASTPRMFDTTTSESGLPESIESDRTIEGDFQSLDYVTEIEMDSHNVVNKQPLESAQIEVDRLLSTVTQAGLDIKRDIKELLPDLTPTPDSNTPLSEFKQFLESQKSEKQSSQPDVKDMMKEMMAGSCLNKKEFWKPSKPVETELPAPSSGNSSPTDSSSNPKSPLSVVKSMSPTNSIQSLPSSPLKVGRSCSVRKLTSESFSSENDISRSLEIVYVEPEVSQLEQMSAQYRTSSPNTGKKFEKRKPSYTQLRRPTSNELRSDSPDKGDFSESDIPSSSSPEVYEMPKAKSVDFTPYMTDIKPLESKKSLSPTKIATPSNYILEQQISSEILSPILDVQSHTPVRSPEKKFEYVQGLQESLESGFEIIKPTEITEPEKKETTTTNDKQ